MNRPIILWSSPQLLTSDEAGTSIIKYVHPPPYVPGPYASPAKKSFHYVPSLTYFCIKTLLKFPDQVHAIGSIRLPYRPPTSPLSYDILRALIPSYSSSPDLEHGTALDLSTVHPCLWATLVQIYDNLPDVFRTYRIPLSDENLPLLQQIPSTPQFSLVTILELPGCPHLSDHTVSNLKSLDTLCAFDASGTQLTAYGVNVLAGTLLWSDGDENIDDEKRRRGPWGLRILSLRNCAWVDNKIFDCLIKFVLLSVVDLRGTRCTPNSSIPPTFCPATNSTLYHPSSISTALSALSSLTTTLFSSPNPYTLHISTLRWPPSPSLSAKIVPQRSTMSHNGYVVLPRPPRSYNLKKTSLKNVNDYRNGAKMTMPMNRETGFRHPVNKVASYDKFVGDDRGHDGSARCDCHSNETEKETKMEEQETGSLTDEAEKCDNDLVQDASIRCGGSSNFMTTKSSLVAELRPSPELTPQRSPSTSSRSNYSPPPTRFMTSSHSPAHSLDLPPSSPPELEFSNLVAEEEASAYMSLQAAKSFYGSHTSTTRRSSTAYYADKCLCQAPLNQPGRGDNPLILFREPPPWSELERMTPRKTTKMESKLKDLAVVNTTGGKAKEAKRLADQVTQKWRKAEVAKTTPRTMPFVESRNPFRRNSVASEGALKSLPIEKNTAQNGSKRLKPISSLKTPSWPQKLGTPSTSKSSVAPRAAAGSVNKDNVSFATPFLKTDREKPKSTSSHLKLRKPNPGSSFPSQKRPAAAEAEPRKRVPIKASDPLPQSTARKGARKAESFDWNRWCEGSK